MMLLSGTRNILTIAFLFWWIKSRFLFLFSSLIPYIYHAKVIKAAVKHKKNVVTTSYVSPAMMEYDQAWVLIIYYLVYIELDCEYNNGG